MKASSVRALFAELRAGCCRSSSAIVAQARPTTAA
jgi:hypothetical protein